jgi:hypothetical protein
MLPIGVTFFGIPGDPGALIDVLKIHNVAPHRLHQLQRQRFSEQATPGYIQRWSGSKTFDCQCGIKFDSEQSRDHHARRRHVKRQANIKDLSECTEAERQAILRDAGEPGLRPGDPGYFTGPGDFGAPDPDDREIAQQDQTFRG